MYSALKLVDEVQDNILHMRDAIRSGPFMKGTHNAELLRALARELNSILEELGSLISYDVDRESKAHDYFLSLEDNVSEVLRAIRKDKLDPEVLIPEAKLKKLFETDLKDAEADLRRLRQALKRLKTDY